MSLWAGGVIWPTLAAAQSPTYSWSGFYVGADVGLGNGQSEFSFSRMEDRFGAGTWGTGSHLFGTGAWDRPAPTVLTSGGFGSIDTGYNWQFGQFVVGAQASFDLGHIYGDTDVNCRAICGVSSTFLILPAAHFGYAAGNVQPFVTVGPAFGNIELTKGLGAGSEETKPGWTVGGGLEWKVTNNVSFALQDSYVNLNSASCDRPLCARSLTAGLGENITSASLHLYLTAWPPKF